MLEGNGSLHDTAIIVLFGPTGSGKTTFANVASGDSMRVGRGLKSCTQKVEPTTMFTVDGKPVVVVDCPGFDDTYLSETEILQSLAGFLTVAYSQNFKITGLLYLHKITDTRVGGASFRHMKMFKEVCGTDSLKNVVYVMNMWSDPPTEDEVLREDELRQSDEFFGGPIAEGAQMARHYNTQESAHNIIRQLLPRPPTVPQLSKQLVDEGLTLEKTNAGVVLGHGLEDEIRQLNDEIRRLREDHAQATRDNNERFKKSLEAQERKAQEKHKKLEQDIESLKQGHKRDEAAWEQRLSEYSASVNASMGNTMTEMLERLDSKHEARVDSLLKKHEQELAFARMTENTRTAALKKAYDEALREARESRGGGCIIA
ncbi:50S ribosome-binding GTPase [Rhizoctonia solani 123E]|uniref:50S ribosome-binding GTPase n=2 Tax=Eukaryota TaxID=2759 RepID=A0A074RRX9_9AGAM|nr:50S ribosome-binding GTPase [Rhizoctonia solani 123E]